MKITIRFDRDGFAVLILCLICVCLLSPYVKQTIGDGPIFLLTFVYLLLEINPILDRSKSEKQTMFLILAYLLILLVYKLIGLSNASIPYHVSIMESFIPFFCILPIYYRLSRKQVVLLLTVIFATMTATMLHNFALKAVWKSMFSQQLYKRAGVKGVATTQYSTAVMLAFGLLFCGFLNAKHAGIRLLFLALSVFFFAFNLFVTQRGIILFLSLLMIPLLSLFRCRQRRTRIILMSLTFLAALLLAVGYQTILGWLAEIISSKRLRIRIESMVDLLSSGGMEDPEESSLTLRLDLIGVSIRTFWASLPNFLFGVGARTDTNQLVGNHSQFFDEFAKYGILIAALCISNVKNMLEITRRISAADRLESLGGQLSVIYFIYLLRSLIGGIFDASIGAVMFIGLPLLFRILNKDQCEL